LLAGWFETTAVVSGGVEKDCDGVAHAVPALLVALAVK
jgi:hypothetical protein